MEIVKYAETSIGLKDGTAAGKEAVRWFAERITELDEELAGIENRAGGEMQGAPACRERTGDTRDRRRGSFPGSLQRWEIFPGLTMRKRLQKLSGLGLVSCSSGKAQRGDQDQPQRAQKAEVLAVPGGAVSGGAWRGIQMDPCPLYNDGREIRSRRCSH